MNLEELLKQLMSAVDTESELDRRKAFESALEFADLHLDYPEYIAFLSMAAEALGQQKLLASIVSVRLKANGREKIHIRYDDEEGCQIIANREGCLYLTRAFRVLALSSQPGARLQLDYDLPPMVGETYPAALYMEDDAYFAENIEDRIDDSDLWPVRDIAPENIAAFFLTLDGWRSMGVTRNRVYPVTGWKWYQGQHMVYFKDIRDDISRMVVLTFNRDDGQSVEIAMDLDDDEIGFITKQELSGLTAGEDQH